MTLLDDPRFTDPEPVDEPVRAFTAWFGFVLDDVPQPGPWSRHARCRTVPPTVFFPERGDDTTTAKRICAGCGVLEQCRTYALDAGPQLRGIWGGLSERERNRVHRPGRRPA